MKTTSAQQTKQQGRLLGQKIVESGAPRVIALRGDLGGGKTTFTQGLAKGLGVKERVLSPTFAIMKKYRGKRNLIHIDCYRVNSEEMLNLGWQEIVSSSDIVVIEWAEKIKDILPKNTHWINFLFVKEKERDISVGT